MPARRATSAGVRIAAGLLAASGVVFLPFALTPLFAPGFIVWLFWLLIAAGCSPLHSRLFWTLSGLWNVCTFIFVLLLRGWHFDVNWGFIYVLNHSFFAIWGSFVIAALADFGDPIDGVLNSDLNSPRH